MADRDPFVGRIHELNVLGKALSAIFDGNGASVTVSGPAGMGKTTVVERLAESAREQGAHVHWGRAREHAGSPPLWPWVHLFRSFIAGGDVDEDLVNRSGAERSDLTPLMPVKRGDTKPGDSYPIADPGAQFRLFDSVTSVLRMAAQRTPLVIVIDNLHWADTASLRLLELVSGELGASRVLFIGTYRDSEARRGSDLSRSISELARASRFSDVRMSPLSRNEVGQLLLAISGLEPPGALVDAIYSHSEGSPFFAQNAIQLLNNQGQLNEQAFKDTADWDIGIPAGVRDVIGTRLDELSEDCVQLLQTAAVIGREFDLQMLSAMFPDRNGELLLEWLEEAIAANIVVESADQPDRFAFDHDLFRQTLESDLNLSRRVRLHSRIATAMDEMFGTSNDEYADRIAYHFRQAETAADPEMVAAACIRAGRVASAAYAYDDAVEHFGAAVQILENSDLHRELLATALEGHGRALNATGRYVDVFAQLERAFEIYLEVGMTDEALNIATIPINVGYPGMNRMHERAVELAVPNTEHMAVLLSRLGFTRQRELRDAKGSEDAFNAAVETARSAGSRLAEAWTFARWAQATEPDWSRSKELAIKAIEIMPPDAGVDLEVQARSRHANALMALGDLDEAESEIERALDAAVRARNPRRQDHASRDLDELRLLQGRWGEILKGGQASDGNVESLSLTVTYCALIYFATGQYALGASAHQAMRDYRDRLQESGVDVSIQWQAYIAVLLGITEDESFIDEVPADELWSTPLDEDLYRKALDQNIIEGIVRTDITGIIAITRRDRATAEATLNLVRAFRYPTNHYINFGGSHDRFKGRLAATAGRIDEATLHFENAYEFCSGHGFVYDHAWTCHDLARLFVQDRRDLQRVPALINEGLRIADEYGIGPLTERLLELKEFAGVVRAAHPAGLTDREVEVLQLIVVGMSNPEIARHLTISTHTVNRHATNLYSKLNVSSRAAATDQAHRLGLV